MCCFFSIYLNSIKDIRILTYVSNFTWFGVIVSHFISSINLIVILIINLYLGEITYSILKIIVQHNNKIKMKKYLFINIVFYYNFLGMFI